jgi:hypothetical protein
MELPFWSDKDRLFVFWGLGMSLNFKFIAKKLGLLREASRPIADEEAPKSESSPQSKRDRLREQIETSKYEEKRH